MGIVNALRRRNQPVVITTESAPPNPQPETFAESVLQRTGYEPAIPRGGTKASAYGVGGMTVDGTDRRSLLQDLFGAYLGCPWASACVDAIARTATSGPLQIVPGEGIDANAPEPPELAEIRKLFGYVNESEDAVQLLRGVVTDLLIFGTAYLEKVRVLGKVVALYSLDAITMEIIADDHGAVTGYCQKVDETRRADFEPEDVICIKLDSPRGGLYGLAPTEKAILPITQWLYMSAWNKNYFKNGARVSVHIDFPSGRTKEVERFKERFLVENTGVLNVGNPLITEGGAKVGEFAQHMDVDFIMGLRDRRDEILSTYGVPPAKIGVIEAGNLGGGTGESQDKTFKFNTVFPIQALITEKLAFHILQQEYGITDYLFRFKEVDYRDSKVIEDIREKRLRLGVWSLNDYRDDVDQPPADGGDDPVLVLSRDIIRWDGLQPIGIQGQPPTATPVDTKPTSAQKPKQVPDDQESLKESYAHALSAYRSRKKKALKEMAKVDQ
ncbi:MAG: phage portal protein [Actinomycetota bacterium]